MTNFKSKDKKLNFMKSVSNQNLKKMKIYYHENSIKK